MCGLRCLVTCWALRVQPPPPTARPPCGCAALSPSHLAWPASHRPYRRALHHAFAHQDLKQRLPDQPVSPPAPLAMASACLAAPAVARPTMAVSGARKSAFFAGSAAMAAPRAATGALASARRQTAVIEARASKASAAGQQITVDVDKPLGLASGRDRDGGRFASGLGRSRACRPTTSYGARCSASFADATCNAQASMPMPACLQMLAWHCWAGVQGALRSWLGGPCTFGSSCSPGCTPRWQVLLCIVMHQSQPRPPLHCSPAQVLDQSKSPKGGLKVKSASGNAAKAGISAGGWWWWDVGMLSYCCLGLRAATPPRRASLRVGVVELRQWDVMLLVLFAAATPPWSACSTLAAGERPRSTR